MHVAISLIKMKSGYFGLSVTKEAVGIVPSPEPGRTSIQEGESHPVRGVRIAANIFDPGVG